MRLTRQEMFLIAGICLALVTGAVVKHYRDSTRAAALHPAKETELKPGIVSMNKSP